MKKSFLTNLVFIVVVLIALIFLTRQSVAEENLLLNPGFEEGGHIDHWINDGSATFIWVADWQQQEGKWSFGVGNDLEYATDSALGRCLQVICDRSNHDNLYTVIPGQTFTFKMWIKAEENYKGNASLKLEFFGYDRRLGFTDKPLASFQSKVHTGQFDWLEETVSGIAPKGTVSIGVSCISENMPKGPGYSFVWFDNGSVTVSSPHN